MDILKFFESRSDKFRSCEHTGFRLQRRPIPKSEIKLGLPGMKPALQVSFKQPDYLYHCPACQQDLPTGENARWEALFNNWGRVTSSKPSGPGKRTTPRISSSRPGAGSGSGSKSVNKREALGARLRYDILTRDSNRCVKCGAGGPGTRLHVDYKRPVVMGGGNEPSNLQTLCERFNLGKGARIG